jgi:hypothetical protein
MIAVVIKRALKRSDALINFVRSTQSLHYKVAGLVRPNIEIARKLAAFTPNSGGSLRAKSFLALQGAEQSFPLLAKLIGTTSDQPLISPVAISTLATTGDNTKELAALLDFYGSDKSMRHDYHLLYGAVLSPRRHERLRLLEVGLGSNNSDVVSTMGKSGKPGASLRAFRDFLPNAEIFGADIDRRILFSDDRIRTFHVDQTNMSSFDELERQLIPGSLDLVIDDGLHSPNANIATLIFALHSLKSSGTFIVEDIACESIPIWQTVAALLVGYQPTLIQAPKALMFMAVKP